MYYRAGRPDLDGGRPGSSQGRNFGLKSGGTKHEAPKAPRIEKREKGGKGPRERKEGKAFPQINFPLYHWVGVRI